MQLQVGIKLELCLEKFSVPMWGSVSHTCACVSHWRTELVFSLLFGIVVMSCHWVFTWRLPCVWMVPWQSSRPLQTMYRGWLSILVHWSLSCCKLLLFWILFAVLLVDHMLMLQRANSSISGSKYRPCILLFSCLHTNTPWEGVERHTYTDICTFIITVLT